jgi:hypothetical protein
MQRICGTALTLGEFRHAIGHKEESLEILLLKLKEYIIDITRTKRVETFREARIF